jgi:hypothetical protein
MVAALLLALTALLSPLPAAAQTGEAVGRVITAVGEVAAIGPNGERRALERRSRIHEGETVVTGDGGRAQVRFKDKGLVDLKPGTRFTVKRYRAKAAGDGEDSAVMELIKGGMRTVTGAVGGGKQQEYEVETPVASIGIRGTQYLLRLCQGDCAGDVPDGLYGNVTQGRIGVMNDAGERVFGGDRYFHVASRDSLPRGRLSPPEGIFQRPRPPVTDEGEVEEVVGVSEIPDMGTFLNALAVSDPWLEDKDVEEDFEVAEDRGDLGATGNNNRGPGAGFAFFDDDTAVLRIAAGFGSVPEGDAVSLDSGDNPIGIVATGTSGNGATAQYDIEVAAGPEPLVSGGDSDLDVRWGRWSGADFTYTRDGGPAQDFNKPLEFVTTNNLTSQSQLARLSGSAIYVRTAGTAPLNVDFPARNPVTINTFRLGVDFTNQTISGASVSMTDDTGADLTLSQDGAVAASQKFTLTMLGTYQVQANGALSGHFVGKNAQGISYTFMGGSSDAGYIQTSGLMEPK